MNVSTEKKQQIMNQLHHMDRADQADFMDLHLHTNVSDGTDTPAELLTCVREAGIKLFSVTDHDAIRGCEVIRGLLTEQDPVFINGVEFSCQDKLGKYHILGYGYDPQTDAVRKVVNTGHSYRMQKVMGRLERLRKEFGIEFPETEIRLLLAMDNPGKPHIGNLMVKYHYAETKEIAIREFINQVHFRGEYVRPEEAIPCWHIRPTGTETRSSSGPKWKNGLSA